MAGEAIDVGHSMPRSTPFGRPLIGAWPYGGVAPFPPPHVPGQSRFSAYAPVSPGGEFQPCRLAAPVARRRSRVGLMVMVVLLAVALLAEVTTLGVVAARRIDRATPAAPVPAVSPVNPDSPAASAAAAQALLTTRSKAVLARDGQAFLAGVDPANPAFVQRQQQLFASLTSLPLSVARWTVRPAATYNRPALAASYAAPVFVTDVEFDYQLTGYDPGVVANAETLTFVRRPTGWVLGGDDDLDNLLPEGGHSEPWDVGPIHVVEGAQVLVIGTPQDRTELPELARVADAAAAAVAGRWSSGWSHKVVVYAPRNRRVISTYFRSDLQSVDATAAVQIQVFGAVPEWSDTSRSVGSRVIFNPTYTRPGDANLPALLRHEFTHVATRSVTTRATPTWLVEGYAEFTAYEGAPTDRGLSPDVADAAAAGHLLPYLPSSIDFYSDGDNYDRSWLLCTYIASVYGPARLKSLYAYPAGSKLNDSSEAVRQGFLTVLGVSQEQVLKDVNRWATSAASNH